MNTKHTPGPWHVTSWAGDAEVPEGCSIGIDDDEGAAGGRDYYLCTVVNGDPVELAANAALVAAAPDLLAALVDAADALLIHCPDAWALPQARAAIAKATGGQS